MQNGVYHVNNLTFNNKVDALIYASTCEKNTIVHWSFYDEVFSQIDWKVPVTETLSDLYKKRAIQLREKYDHLVLSYSGGADSTNILQTFIKNNILLDEIVILKPTNNFANSLWEECDIAAIPYLKQYLKNSATKVRVINISDYVNTFFENNLDTDYNTLNWLSPSSMYMSSLIAHDEFWNSLYIKNKKIAFIVGIDKPRIELDAKDNFSCSFLDSMAGVNQNLSWPLSKDKLTYSDENFTFEYFYWTPDVPLLVVKQCQLIKDACLKFKQIKKIIATNQPQVLLYRTVINYIIYEEDVTAVQTMYTNEKYTVTNNSITNAPHNKHFFKGQSSYIIGRYSDMVLNTHKHINSRFFQPVLYNQPKFYIPVADNFKTFFNKALSSQIEDNLNHNKIITDIDKLPSSYKMIMSRKYSL